jgi:integrase
MDAGVAQRLFGGPGPVRARTLRAAKAWKEAGLRGVTLHEGRHTYASLMIAAGVNAKALSTFMGHATIAVTIDLYGHLMPGSEAEAADLLGAYLARSAEPTSPATSPSPVRAAA